MDMSPRCAGLKSKHSSGTKFRAIQIKKKGAKSKQIYAITKCVSLK